MDEGRAQGTSAPENGVRPTAWANCANAECGQSFEYERKGGQRPLYCKERCRLTAKRRRRGQKPQKTPNPESKTCTGCRELKPANAFHFKKLASGALRLNPTCKECSRAMDRRRRPRKAGVRACAWCGVQFTQRHASRLYHNRSCRGAAMRARSKERHARPKGHDADDGMKTCRTCERRKPLADFAAKDKERRFRAPDCRPCQSNIRQRAAIRARLGLPPDAPLPRGRSRPEGYSYVTKHGYVLEKRSGHHRADRRGWVGQHILAFEDHFDVRVPRGYTVHHKDDDRSNNDWRNLELRVGQHGKHGNVVPTLLRHEEYLVETLETIVNNPAYLARNLSMLRDLGLIPPA